MSRLLFVAYFAGKGHSLEHGRVGACLILLVFFAYGCHFGMICTYHAILGFSALFIELKSCALISFFLLSIDFFSEFVKSVKGVSLIDK